MGSGNRALIIGGGSALVQRKAKVSHVTTVELEINDLKALKAACDDLGLEFLEGQKTYKWYGRHVGDYPLPEGFTANQLGKCEHAIGIGDDGRAYEIGVCKNPNGKGYTLLFDFYAGGQGLMQMVSTDGKNANKLLQRYSTQVAKRKLKRKGMRVKEIVENGKVRLIAK